MSLRKLLFATALALGVSAVATAEPVSFTLEGVEDRGGTLYISVQTEEQYQQQAGVAGDIIRGPTAGTMEFDFDLPLGDYAVSVWHDHNGNDEFDFDENGMPADGWTASNAANLRGAPTFQDVKFTVGTGGVELKERMIYPTS
ncbi:MAG: DUF2141 domain-containing protein [Pseudomonadota bacterium]